MLFEKYILIHKLAYMGDAPSGYFLAFCYMHSAVVAQQSQQQWCDNVPMESWCSMYFHTQLNE